MERRVEVLAPVEDPRLLTWLREEYLQAYLDDRARSREMLPDGRYQRVNRDDGPDVHQMFLRR